MEDRCSKSSVVTDGAVGSFCELKDSYRVLEVMEAFEYQSH